MTLLARSATTIDRSSRRAGFDAASELKATLGCAPVAVLVYLTIHHDQAAFLGGVREALGVQSQVIGCSTQGVMGRGMVREDGYGASLLGLAGDLEVTSARAEQIAEDTFEKGRQLGTRLRATSSAAPRFVVLHYDQLTGVDVGLLIDGLFSVVECPIVGGAASHYYEGPMHQTFTFDGERAESGGAVAMAVWGDFAVEMAVCQGCSPSGVEMTVTRADGNVILELDGRSALEVWLEMTGGREEQRETTALAIGVVDERSTSREQLIRAAFVLDHERRGVIVGAAIPSGTRVMLHHRAVKDVLDGAQCLGRDLLTQLKGREPVAVIGFECGARTRPFLGDEATLQENLELQRTLGPEAAWVGAMMWGELFPVGGRPGFHSYTFPVVVLAE